MFIACYFGISLIVMVAFHKRCQFVLEDVWIGLYFKTAGHYDSKIGFTRTRTFYLCLVPCFPIVWTRVRYYTCNHHAPGT